MSLRLTLLVCGCLLASGASAARPPARALPDSAEGLPIARIEVSARNIFDPVPPGRLARVFSLANRLHVRTREKTVRDQLLFQRGQPWSVARGSESRRKLRALDFLEPSMIRATREGDSAVVHVETRDIWSTSPEFNIESADGKQYGSIELSERNFLGLGKAISVTYRDLPSGRSRSFNFTDPSVQGTRINLRYSASDGATGADDDIEIGQPFYAEDAPSSYGFQWNRTTSIAALYEGSAEVATFNRRLESWGVSAGLGRRGKSVIQRISVAFESADRRFGPTQALPEAPPEFLGGEESLRLRRFLIEGRLWQPSYIERVRVNGFGLIEDFDVGSSFSAGVGYSPRLLGSSQDEAFIRSRLATGIVTPLGFGQLSASASSRIQTVALETVAQLDARWVQQSRFAQTFVLAARGIVGRNPARDFEAIVGGLNGLRAYPVSAVSGQRLWRFNAENRWTVGERYWESLTLGAVVFTDAARAWGPGSADAKWFVASGLGVRISLPQWSIGQVMRLDIAWPVEPKRDGQRLPVLSFGSSQAF